MGSAERTPGPGGEYSDQDISLLRGAEVQKLIDWLQAHQTRPEFTCRVRWAPGTLTVWDNRCTQHFAVNDYHGERRRMRRLTVGPQVPR